MSETKIEVQEVGAERIPLTGKEKGELAAEIFRLGMARSTPAELLQVLLQIVAEIVASGPLPVEIGHIMTQELLACAFEEAIRVREHEEACTCDHGPETDDEVKAS